MNGSKRPSHYLREIGFVVLPVKDTRKARAFYEGVLGFGVAKQWQDDWIEYDIGSGTLAITKEDERHKAGQHGATVAFEVEDLDQLVACLTSLNVVIRDGPWDSPACFGCVICDPDGNELILHKRKES